VAPFRHPSKAEGSGDLKDSPKPVACSSKAIAGVVDDLTTAARASTAAPGGGANGLTISNCGSTTSHTTKGGVSGHPHKPEKSSTRRPERPKTQ
jgi:hypothetical protein